MDTPAPTTMGVQFANMDQPVNPELPSRMPFPGAMMQAPGGPLIAPSGDVQTFNEPQPGPGGLKAGDLKEAMLAVQSAMRFQGARGLSEDLQRGIPPDQALLRNGAKMFYNSPAAFGAAMTKMGIGGMKGGGDGPYQLRSVLAPDGQEVEGIGLASGSGGSVHIVSTDKAAVQKAKQAAADVKAATTRSQKLLDAAIKDRDQTAALSPKYAAKQALVEQLQAKLAGAPSAAPAPRVVKWEDFLKQKDAQ